MPRHTKPGPKARTRKHKKRRGKNRESYLAKKKTQEQK